MGALLLAGLFFYSQKTKTRAELVIEKPSQLDFKQSNHIAELKSPTRDQAAESEVVSKPSSLHSVVLPKAESLQGEDKNKWLIFQSILQSKNDNDRRLDLDLKKMSPAVHEALYEQYESLPDEEHSGKGLIAYLVARDLETTKDIQFLQKIYQEKPCLSLADCKTLGADDAHLSSVEQTTLIYKQMSALYVIEQQLATEPQRLNNASYRNGIIQILIQAESFPVATVQEKARAIRTKFNL